MRKILDALLWLPLFLWQLPQGLCALAYILWLRVFHGEFSHVAQEFGKSPSEPWYWYHRDAHGAVTLGGFIVLRTRYMDEQDTLLHEWGHTRQSLMLGPLYLPVVGLPSIVWAALYGSVIPRSRNGYYRFYTERWADRLGGVVRE